MCMQEKWASKLSYLNVYFLQPVIILGHMDINIPLLQSHGAAKLLPMRGTTNPAQMWQGVP